MKHLQLRSAEKFNCFVNVSYVNCQITMIREFLIVQLGYQITWYIYICVCVCVFGLVSLFNGISKIFSKKNSGGVATCLQT